MNPEKNSVACDSCVYRTYLFDMLSNEELARVNSHKREHKFRKGELICREGDKNDEFLYLKEGLAKLYKGAKGRHEHIITIAKPRDFVGLLSLFSNSEHIYSVRAIEDSIVCFIKLEVIRDLIRINGEFSMSLLEKMSTITNRVVRIQIDLAGKHLRGRIAYVILMFSTRIYQSAKFDLPISRKEMGDLIDMRTENVIRILSEFRKDGLIRIEGKTIEVLDIELLQKICELG